MLVIARSEATKQSSLTICSYWIATSAFSLLAMTTRVLITLSLISLFATATFASGDEPTASMPAPAKYDLAGIKHFAFAPFSYEVTYQKGGSSIIPTILRYEIKKSGTFEVAEQTELEPLDMDQKTPLSKLIQIGRKARADAVISGNVTAYQVLPDKESGISKAEVAFCIDIVNIRKGRITDHHCYARKGTETLKSKEKDGKKLTHEERMLMGVTTALSEKIAAAIAPHD